MPGTGLPRLQPYSPPAETRLQIVFEDEALLAIHKPAGLLSVPGRTSELADCVLSRVRQYCPQALLVHRLDEATSGLLLLAKSTTVQTVLSQAFASRQVHKTYHAIVHGILSMEEVEIDAPVCLDVTRRPLRIVNVKEGKPARTIVRLLSKDERSGCSRLLLEPITGRTHQLRVHLKHIGHPIVGDVLYGDHAGCDAPRLMLHASELKFTHPLRHEKRVQIHCPAPF